MPNTESIEPWHNIRREAEELKARLESDGEAVAILRSCCTLCMTRDNPQGPILPLVSEIERLFHQRKQENRTHRAMYQGNEPVNDEQHQNVAGNAGAIARPRTIRDHLTPILDDLNPGIVALKIQATHFEPKPVMFNMLNSIGQFGGSPHEDAKQHIHVFLEVCDSFRQQRVHEDVLKLKLFPYSLRDRARAWLSGVPAGFMESWADLCHSFLMRYNPPNMHTRLRNDIASFRKADDESMYECWDRYKGWRQHPNFSWGNQCGTNANSSNRQQNMQAPPGFQTNMPWQYEAKGNASTSYNNSLEATMQEFISFTKTLLHDHSNAIKNQGNLLQTQGALLQNHGSSLRALENQVGQIAQALQVRPQGGLPSDTEVTKRKGKEQCSALTLRSGTTINKDVEFGGEENIEATLSSTQKESEVPDKLNEEEGREGIQSTKPSRGQCVDATAKAVPTQSAEDVRPPPPFPQRLKKHKEDTQFKKFVDILDQLHIDVPFLEAIDQMPTYAKFLKDIITKKRKIERHETVATTKEYVCTLVDVPPKRNEQGSFIIPCSIGDNYIGKALCDLRSSVNLMPKSVFMKLGMGVARPTTVILQLADRSHVRLEGKVEDLLVKVGKFIFPTDFLILDCEADDKAPIILGRPFLATGRILIDCEKGEFTMRVGDQTMTINVFNTIRYMDDDEGCHYLQDSIATATVEDTELCYSNCGGYRVMLQQLYTD
ncbi:hypothetical protein V6N12_046470 [Hibiscus sabdariffa]|uniref:Retrotransposon gag domain-containing protein n=1 Tax=Hibiscus sabdariffa TaxID=183260 RepID=A0ABR2DIQ8_9ROSI